MLIIRKEQMEMMSRSREALFERQLMDHLHKTFPNRIKIEGLDTAVLHRFVKYGISQARSWGITSCSGIQQYIDCSLVLGPDFAHDIHYPWAGRLLQDESLSGQEKAEGLSWHMLSEINWEEHPDG